MRIVLNTSNRRKRWKFRIPSAAYQVDTPLRLVGWVSCQDRCNILARLLDGDAGPLELQKQICAASRSPT